MAGAAVMTILELQRRAADYASSPKCGYAAAAEKMQQAVVLAQRLPGLPEDNLVALYLMAERSRLLSAQAARTCRLSGGDTDESREFLAAAASSFRHVITGLIRCVDAGTLQPGCCAPLEGAWLVAHDAKAYGRTFNNRERVHYGQLVGLTALYLAAHEALVQSIHIEMESLDSHLRLVLHALDSLSKPRPLEKTVLKPELMFVRAMQECETKRFSERIAATHPTCSGMLQRIDIVWARVQASGILQRRNLHVDHPQFSNSAEETRRKVEAADARQARRGLRSCGLASCGAKEAHADHFKRCSACHTVVYCSKEHQLEDWPAHKAACKAARKAAAAEGAAAA